MRDQSGRSLIEIIGVMAIGAMMAVGSIATYRMIRTNQTRTIASSELEQIARDVKILMDMRGTFDGVSVDYLIKAGARKNSNPPIGGDAWSVTAAENGAAFEINLVDLSEGDCAYFAAKKPQWAASVFINGFSDNTGAQCFSTQTNRVSFLIK